MTDKCRLDFVAPDKRAEVTRRINTVEKFLNEGGGTALAKRLARELGLSLSHFYNLARIWNEDRNPAALHGAGRPKINHDRLKEEQRTIIDEAMQRLTDGTHEDIARLAATIGERRAVPMPIFSTTRKYVRRHRRARLPSSSPAVGVDLVIEHCAINVGVVGIDGEAYRPIATICTSVRDARVRSVGLSLDGAPASAAAKALAETLSEAKLTGDGSGSLAVYLDLLEGADWAKLGTILGKASIERIGEHRSSIRRADATLALLGSRVAGLTLHPRTTNRPFESRPAKLTQGANPVSMEEAERYVRARLLDLAAPSLELAGPSHEIVSKLIKQLSHLGA